MAFTTIASNDDGAVAGLCSGLPNVFCAGADVKDLSSRPPPGRVRRMYLTGEPLTAEASRLGAIEEIVPDGSEFGRTMTVAHQIARMTPIAIRISKRALDAAEGMPIGEGYQLEQECMLRQGATADAREGIAAFREERSPVWTAAELRAEYLCSGSLRNGLPRIICTASGGTPGTTAAAVTWLDSATVEGYNKDMFHLIYAEDRWPR